MADPYPIRPVSPDEFGAFHLRDLGAACLGSTRLGALAAAGVVRELRPGTLAPLSAAMSWPVAPWCPVIF
ncbi:MAG TPA: hypothetical protein VG164_15305 [Trebonia sp.]|jgi:hypothetical protein|nr:hypothetical protein [Trebonia sp.]